MVDLRKQQYVDYDFLKFSLVASLAVIFVCFNLIMLFLSPSFYVKNDSYNKELYYKGDYVKKDILSFCESAYTNINEIINIDRLKTCLKNNEGLFNYYLKILKEGNLFLLSTEILINYSIFIYLRKIILLSLNIQTMRHV